MTSIQKQPFSRTQQGLLAGILALISLALMIAISPQKRCYDEFYHLNLVQDAHERGWNAASTSPKNESAAGPLYAAIHLLARPVTRLEAPAVRWVNYCCLLLVMVTVAASASGGFSHPDLLAGFSLMSVPFIWPTSGMALTELPALAAFSLFILTMKQVIQNQEGILSFRSFSWAIASGVFLGLSVLGRQTYLVAVPVVGFMCFMIPRKWPSILLCLSVTAISCVWLFMLWRGLVPPALSSVNGGLRLEYGILSLSYVAAATLFLQPNWITLPSKGILFGVLASGVALTMVCTDYASPPAKSLLLGAFGQKAGLALGFILNSLFTTAGILWAWTAAQRAWQSRRDPWRSFLFLTLFTLVVTPAKVSHMFSTRYLVGLLGVLILIVERPPSSPPRWYTIRILIGSMLGAASLWTYYR